MDPKTNLPCDLSYDLKEYQNSIIINGFLKTYTEKRASHPI
jgi:hypothetical protein